MSISSSRLPKAGRGFTFIEMLIVVMIVAISMPAFFTIVFSLVREQYLVNRLQRVKESGDFSERKILELVRNRTIKTDATCANSIMAGASAGIPAARKICFVDSSKVPFGFYIDDTGRLASMSANLAAQSYVEYLLNTEDSDFPVAIDPTTAAISLVSEKIVKFVYTVKHQPTVGYLTPVAIDYQYYIYLRR